MVCLTALQPFIKALLSIIWCSQLKLRKAFGVVWLILPPQSLCSLPQRCCGILVVRTGSVVITQVKLYMCLIWKWSRFHTWFPRMLWIFISIISKQNQKNSTSIMIKHSICIRQLILLILLLYSNNDWYHPYISIFDTQPYYYSHKINNLSIIFLASNIVRLRFNLAMVWVPFW